MRKLPPLNALRAFEAAARHLSFKSAADELFVTPTAISHQIKLLEQLTGQQLFRRRPRPISLTPSGVRLFPILRQGFDSFSAAVAALSEDAANAPLRVSTTTAFASRWLLPRLGNWNDQHPSLNLEVIATEQVVDLRSGEIDMAIRYAKHPPTDLEAVPLFEDRFLPVCSPRLLEGLPVDDWVGVISKLTLLHFHWKQQGDPDAPSWPLWRAMAQLVDRRAESIDPKRGSTLSEEHMAIEAAIAGQGVALASSVLVERELKMGLLQRVSDVSIPGRTFYAVSVRTLPRKQLVDRFVQWAQDDNSAIFLSG